MRAHSSGVINDSRGQLLGAAPVADEVIARLEFDAHPSQKPLAIANDRLCAAIQEYLPD